MLKVTNDPNLNKQTLMDRLVDEWMDGWIISVVKVFELSLLTGPKHGPCVFVNADSNT